MYFDVAGEDGLLSPERNVPIPGAGPRSHAFRLPSTRGLVRSRDAGTITDTARSDAAARAAMGCPPPRVTGPSSGRAGGPGVVLPHPIGRQERKVPALHRVLQLCPTSPVLINYSIFNVPVLLRSFILFFFSFSPYHWPLRFHLNLPIVHFHLTY